MEPKNKNYDDRLATEIAFMMGKYGDSASLLEKLQELREEYGCFSF